MLESRIPQQQFNEPSDPTAMGRELKVSFAQKRFAIRMHDDVEVREVHDLAKETKVEQPQHSAQFAPASFVQQRFAVRMHEFEQ